MAYVCVSAGFCPIASGTVTELTAMNPIQPDVIQKTWLHFNTLNIEKADYFTDKTIIKSKNRNVVAVVFRYSVSMKTLYNEVR